MVYILSLTLIISSCDSTHEPGYKQLLINGKNKKSAFCTDDCIAGNKSALTSCKLTTPELQHRRETVLLSLKKQMKDKKELANGYAFKFSGSDQTFDELTEFIKTERQCCDFFTFTLSVSGDKSEAWLEMTGVKGAKEFISAELGL